MIAMGQRYYSSVAQKMSLTADMSSSALTMAVTSTAGLPTSVPFTLLVDVGLAEEVVTVTAVSGLTLTVTRGEDGTSAQAHTSGAQVVHAMTARDLREPQQHINATAGVHGLPAGANVLGDTSTQTVTNKTMSGASNTFTAIPQSAVVGVAAHIAGTSAVHGLAAGSNVVGTTSAQTLTNKTISGASNTLADIPQTAVTGLVTASIPDAADLNTYLTPGKYTQGADASAAAGANYPEPMAGLLEVGGSSGTSVTYQRYTTYKFTSGLGDRTYVRSLFSGTWSAWREVGGVAPGAITMFAGATAPSGWLLCDGAAYSRTTYADLFATLGTTYGAGDGSTTFNVPRLTGRVPVGLDSTQTEFNARGKTGGEKTHQLTVAEMPSHTHPLTVAGQPAVAGQTSNPAAAGGSFYTASGGVGAITAGNTGGDGAHNNLQPYIVLNFVIKA